MRLYGGIEAGGTKFICAVAEQPNEAPVDTITIPTTTPDDTIARTVDFFKQHQVKALGVASFALAWLTSLVKGGVVPIGTGTTKGKGKAGVDVLEKTTGEVMFVTTKGERRTAKMMFLSSRILDEPASPVYCGAL